MRKPGFCIALYLQEHWMYEHFAFCYGERVGLYAIYEHDAFGSWVRRTQHLTLEHIEKDVPNFQLNSLCYIILHQKYQLDFFPKFAHIVIFTLGMS